MRSLGDMRWLNDYIGIPYRHGGRDMAALDCYGLIKVIYAKEYGIHLPDWVTDKLDFKTHDRIISSIVCSGEFTEIEQPSDGTIVVCYRTRMAYHVGLFFAGGVIHSDQTMGVIYEPLNRFEQNYQRVIFGEWQP